MAAFGGAFILGLLALIAGLSTAQEYTCSDTEFTIDAVESCINAVRTNPGYWGQFVPCTAGLAPRAPLFRDGSLQGAATHHTNDMAATGFMGHTGSDGSAFSTRIWSMFGFTGGAIAENVAEGYNSALSVVGGWMCSGGHRDNIMSCDYNSMGTGTQCNGYGRCYSAQTFGCYPANTCSCNSNHRVAPPPPPPPPPAPVPAPIPAPPTEPPPPEIPSVIAASGAPPDDAAIPTPVPAPVPPPVPADPIPPPVPAPVPAPADPVPAEVPAAGTEVKPDGISAMREAIQKRMSGN